MKKKLKAESIENRGSVKVPFGWVYFNDGARVGYSHGKVWDREDYNSWELLTPEHIDTARKVLKEKGLIDEGPKTDRKDKPKRTST